MVASTAPTTVESKTRVSSRNRGTVNPRAIPRARCAGHPCASVLARWADRRRSARAPAGTTARRSCEVGASLGMRGKPDAAACRTNHSIRCRSSYATSGRVSCAAHGRRSACAARTTGARLNWITSCRWQLAGTTPTPTRSACAGGAITRRARECSASSGCADKGSAGQKLRNLGAHEPCCGNATVPASNQFFVLSGN